MRVMILEDDPWIADLLKQIVLSLRPGAKVACLERLSDALLDWQQHGADLVIADWNLPDGQGTRLLEQIRQHDRQLPLLMVTARTDRASVLEVRPLGISAFIGKPFQVPKVLECLEKLLPADNPQDPAEQIEPAGDFLAHLAGLPASALDLPLNRSIRDLLLQSCKGEQPGLRELAEDWQHDPALSARLLAVANSSAYNGGGRPCLSLLEALQRLGGATSLNLAMALALRQSSALQNAQLRMLADEHLGAAERLAEKSVALARQCHLDPAPLYCAALLHRMGELCVLYLAQAWENSGGSLSEAQVRQALEQFSAPFAIAIKARWQLPMALRELIGACYGLPSNNVKQANILMRLASSELDAHPDSHEQARLRRLAGLA